MTPGPALAGLKVVEETNQVRGRYLGRLFGELGAHVTRVVPAAQRKDSDSPWLDCAKHFSDRSILDELISRADVFIGDASPTEFRDHMLANPTLVQVSVTPFGLDGPWANREATDLIISALSGMAGINGYSDGMPIREPGVQAEMVGALMGFIGALAALEEREQSGRGQLVESSCMEAIVNVLAPAVVQWSYTGSGPQRKLRGTDMLFECADGWISLYIFAERAWDTIVTVLEVVLDPADDRFASEAGRRVHAKAMREVLEPYLQGRSRKELYDLLSPMRVVAGMVMHPRDLLHDEHLVARKAFVQAADGLRIPRIAIRSRGEHLTRFALGGRSLVLLIWRCSAGCEISSTAARARGHHRPHTGMGRLVCHSAIGRFGRPSHQDRVP